MGLANHKTLNHLLCHELCKFCLYWHKRWHFSSNDKVADFCRHFINLVIWNVKIWLGLLKWVIVGQSLTFYELANLILMAVFASWRSSTLFFSPYCPVLSCMRPYGPVWSRMALFGPVLSSMVLYGPVWYFMVPYTPVWSRMVLYDLISYQLFSMVLYGPVGTLWYSTVP